MKKLVKNLKFKIRNYGWNKGMTYVELIVVLSIFTIMSSAIIYNYGLFQSQIDIKNLAADIALQIVQAQKFSLSGKIPPVSTPPGWKPSYGVYFNKLTDNKSFIYFADRDQDGILADPDCSGSGECLNKITITKGNSISKVDVFYQGDPTPYNVEELSITFKRPDSKANIKSPAINLALTLSYVQVTVSSPKDPVSVIKVYPSGRIQVN